MFHQASYLASRVARSTRRPKAQADHARDCAWLLFHGEGVCAPENCSPHAAFILFMCSFCPLARVVMCTYSGAIAAESSQPAAA